MDTCNLAGYVTKVRKKAPLIHNITNYVTVNDCANVLLACGAAPVMSDDAEDAPQITAISGGLNLNIGTLSDRTIPAMLASGSVALQSGIPCLLDPVGAGATRKRTDTALRLMREVHPQVVRGNMSEIRTLAAEWQDEETSAGMTRGVDAAAADRVTEENLDEAVRFAKGFAVASGCTVAITGAIDVVADAEKAFCIRNGHAMMSRITGSGCQLSAMTCAYLAASHEGDLAGEAELGTFTEAAAAAVCAMGVAGEAAAKRMGPLDGNASFRTYLIDAVCTMTEEQFQEAANYDVR